MPASMRSGSRPSSATVHITFCTLMEFLRPQIFSMAVRRPYALTLASTPRMPDGFTISTKISRTKA